jgi:hypothetical protein
LVFVAGENLNAATRKLKLIMLSDLHFSPVLAVIVWGPLDFSEIVGEPEA